LTLHVLAGCVLRFACTTRLPVPRGQAGRRTAGANNCLVGSRVCDAWK
jgi:hypothetical protein